MSKVGKEVVQGLSFREAQSSAKQILILGGRQERELLQAECVPPAHSAPQS